MSPSPPPATLKSVIVELNNREPSSEALARILSAGKDIFRPKKGGLGDFDFEKLIHLKYKDFLFSINSTAGS